MESLQTIASLAPVALSMAPYLAAFSTQHKDEHFHKAIAAHFPAAGHLRRASEHKAWITDTFAEVNGVSRTIQVLAQTARTMGRKLVVLTSMENSPDTKVDLKNFRPVGTFPMPEYESQTLAFPPFLEIFEYIERHRFNELIISTPGPMGLTGLAAARLLGLRTTGIYHTDFVQYVRHLTQDDDLADLTWQYMRWFYDQCTMVLVPTETYRRQLIDNGFEPARLGVMARGVDTRLFHPSKATPGLFDRYGLANRFHYLYVGRISKEKNVDALVEAFEEILRRGYQASLVFVGDGPQRQALEAGCRGRPIAFTGILEGDALARGLCQRRLHGLPFDDRYLRQRGPGGACLGVAGHRVRPGRSGGNRAAARFGIVVDLAAAAGLGRCDGKGPLGRRSPPPIAQPRAA